MKATRFHERRSSFKRPEADHQPSGCDLQIIDCTGTGRTEAISHRVASLLADEVEPVTIIALRFIEKAGALLKGFIYSRGQGLLGKYILDRLDPMYVGTIHGRGIG